MPNRKYIFIFILLILSNFIYAQNPEPGSLQGLREQNEQQTKKQNQEHFQRNGVEQPQAYNPNQSFTQKQSKRDAEFNKLLTELKQETTLPVNQKHPLEDKLKMLDTNTLVYKQKGTLYHASYWHIVYMLQGKDNFDLKKAVWVSEYPAHQKVSYPQFCAWVQDALSMVKYILLTEKLDVQNADHLHYALRKLYTDTLRMYNPKTKKVITYYPFTYDFNDPMAEANTYNYSVSKLLQTHKGQCHSMPLLYLILAQELKIDAYLSYTPLHSFIQYYDKAGYLQNFETTNGHLATRDYYMASGFIKVEAIRNGIYLKTIVPQKVLATLLIDLANYYQKEMGYSDFLTTCVSQCITYFPNYVNAQLLYENTYTALALNVAKKYNYPPKEEAYKYPDLKEALETLAFIQHNTDESGYEAIAPETYQEWVNPKKKSKTEEKRKKMQDTRQKIQDI
ncbi:MAG: hypothetical protein U0V72_13930 [Cytophagales bacterium]